MSTLFKYSYSLTRQLKWKGKTKKKKVTKWRGTDTNWESWPREKTKKPKTECSQQIQLRVRSGNIHIQHKCRDESHELCIDKKMRTWSTARKQEDINIINNKSTDRGVRSWKKENERRAAELESLVHYLQYQKKRCVQSDLNATILDISNTFKRYQEINQEIERGHQSFKNPYFLQVRSSIVIKASSI